MDVFGHHNVASDYQEIARANALQRIFKELHGRDWLKVRPAAVTTKSEEVELPGLLIADALTFHAPRGYSRDGRAGGDERVFRSPVPKGEGPGAPGISHR